MLGNTRLISILDSWVDSLVLSFLLVDSVKTLDLREPSQA